MQSRNNLPNLLSSIPSGCLTNPSFRSKTSVPFPTPHRPLRPGHGTQRRNPNEETTTLTIVPLLSVGPGREEDQYDNRTQGPTDPFPCVEMTTHRSPLTGVARKVVSRGYQDRRSTNRPGPCGSESLHLNGLQCVDPPPRLSSGSKQTGSRPRDKSPVDWSTPLAVFPTLWLPTACLPP